MAQQPAPGYRPVFGAAEASAPGATRVDVMLDVSEAWDQDVYADIRGASPTVPQTGGTYTSFTPQFNMKTSGRHVETAITANSNGRLYRDNSRYQTTTNALGAGLKAQVSQHATLMLNQGLTYTPAYLYGLFADTAPPELGDPVAPAPDYYSGAPESIASLTSASLDRQVGARGHVTFDGSYRFNNVDEAPGYNDLTTYSAGAHLGRAVNRNTSLRLGYVYTKSEYSATFTPVEHRPEFAVDYTRPLSATRNATFSFTVSPLMLQGATLADGRPSDEMKYSLGGSASFNYPMTRTWTLGAGFSSGTSFVEGFTEPLTTNSASVAFGGFVNRRTDLSFHASGSMGESVSGSPFSSSTANARVRIALNRMLATTFDYLFYYYDFDNGIAIPPGMSPQLTRNGVRVGLTIWAPVRH